MHERRSKLDKTKRETLLEHFVARATAWGAAELFADKRNHINGIENFWNQAKRHLRRFNGIPKQSFYLFLKECEWRFNASNHRELLKQLKAWTKSRLERP